MLRVSSYTFGCKLNQSETDAALAILTASDYQLVDWDSGADLYLVNTCTVTTKGEQKARRLIRKVLRLWPRASVLVAGCYAVLERERLEDLGERVCALPDQPAQICEVLARKPLANGEELLELLRSSIDELQRNGGRKLEAGMPRRADFPIAFGALAPMPLAPMPLAPMPLAPVALGAFTPMPLAPKMLQLPSENSETSGTRAKRQRYFLKIQDGCNRTCSFCRIRLARGPSRSLPLPELITLLQNLENQGYSEVVVTGVHINSYHYRDAQRDYYLGDLLLALLEHSQHIRLRLSSLEPEGLHGARAQTLFRALAAKRICPHFHISLQSGSEHVLRQMRRSYTAQQQLAYIRHLKHLQPRAFFSCDAIVGFPSESEEDFAATLGLLEELEFSAVHAFSYSPRPGTEAWDMPKVQEQVVKQRMQRIQELADRLHQAYLMRCCGQKVSVLLESSNDGYWFGYSENYVRTKISNLVNADWRAGDLVQVQLQIPATEQVTDAMLGIPYDRSP